MAPNSYPREFWEPCGWVTWAALTSMTDIMLPFSPPSWGMLRSPGSNKNHYAVKISDSVTLANSNIFLEYRIILIHLGNHEANIYTCFLECVYWKVFSCLTRPTSANLGLPLLDALRAGQTSTKHESWRVTAASFMEFQHFVTTAESAHDFCHMHSV